MTKRLISLTIALLLCGSIGLAQPKNLQRPTVGVTLGGGGAKGAAHIGVLKYMHELGIPIDYVSGTSMGAIIGGLTALGYPPQELQDIISSMDWAVYMSDAISRNQMTSTNRQRHSTYILTIPFDTGTLGREMESWEKRGEESNKGYSFISSLPSGFVGGINLLNLFNNLSVGYQASISIDSLPIPFACVATNVADGSAEVLRSGCFPTAIRASMAIPGVFSPVTIDGKLLMDGGMVNNFPADICKEMGADIVIGIEVADELHDDIDELQSLPQLINQLMNIAVKNKKEENRKLCDIYIRPDITEYNTLSFNTEAIDTLVQRGYNEAKRYKSQLLAIKAMLDSYGDSQHTLQAPRANNITDDTITINAIHASVPQEEFNWMMIKGDLRPNKSLTGAEVDKAVGRIMGTGGYASILYRLSPTQDSIKAGNRLYPAYRMDIETRPANPHTSSIGFRYESQESAALLFSLGFNQNRLSGWKGLLSARLGYNTILSASISKAGNTALTSNLNYTFHRGRYDVLKPNMTRALMRNYTHHVSFTLSELHLLDYSISAGIFDEYAFYIQPPTPDSSFYGCGTDLLHNNSLGAFVKARFDNMDDAYFARHGNKTDLSASWQFNTSGTRDEGYATLALSTQTHITPNEGRLTIIPQIHTRMLFGDDYHFSYRNIIGEDMSGAYVQHMLPFVGTNAPRISEDITAILRCDLRYNIGGRHYVTLMVNYLHDAAKLSTLFGDNSHDWWGVGCRYAINSAIGPIALDAHWSTLSRTFGLFLNIGYIF